MNEYKIFVLYLIRMRIATQSNNRLLIVLHLFRTKDAPIDGHSETNDHEFHSVINSK